MERNARVVMEVISVPLSDTANSTGNLSTSSPLTLTSSRWARRRVT
jgi:hypothetical protein